jgi:hypothetical protein
MTENCRQMVNKPLMKPVQSARATNDRRPPIEAWQKLRLRQLDADRLPMNRAGLLPRQAAAMVRRPN